MFKRQISVFASASANAAVFLPFILGILLGVLCASFSLPVSGAVFIPGFSDRSFLAGLFIVFRFPLLLAFFGLSAAGVFLIPVLSCLRGFFLSFSVSYFFKSFGSAEFRTVLLYFGIESVIVVPVFFVLAVCFLQMSSAVLRAGKGAAPSAITAGYRPALLLAVSALLLVAAAAYDCYVLPLIL